jgi:hypothetical protein
VRLQNLVALGIAGALLGASSAHAFGTVTCNGQTLKWQSGTLAEMTRNKCSVANDSTQATSYFSAINRWNQVRGAADKVEATFMTDPDQCFIDLNDGINDFALVDEKEIDGALGGTFVWRSCPTIHSIDILMANHATQSFGNPDESFAAGSGSSTGRFATLHEFGHGLGLSITPAGSSINNHVNGFAVMRASTPTPLAGGLGQQHARVMPDDAKGLRHLYPNGNEESNLMASAQRLNGTKIENNTANKTVSVCRGDSVTFNWTMVNAGTETTPVDNRFFLHASADGHNSTGVTLGHAFNFTVNPNHALFPSSTRKIPCGTAPGTYFLFHEVDANDDFDEWNEADNVVRLALKVKVANCGCAG